MFGKKNFETEEERIAFEKAKAEKKAKKAERREERWEKFKDGFCEVGGAMLPIVLPIVAMIGVGVAGAATDAKKSKKREQESNELDDLLAKGKGFEGRKDPNYVAWRYDEANKEQSSSDEEDEE